MNFSEKCRLLIVGSLIFSVLTAGCATYQSKVEGARHALVLGNYDFALSTLKTLSQKEDGDQLVYLLDYGIALQIAGQVQESSRSLLKADVLAESKDYHSVSRVAGSLALNEEMLQYKGDTFEKIFINAYLAMNFLQLGKLDDALVEARRINEKYQKARAEESKSYGINSFSKYLSAITWEASGNYDDAYIAYADAYKIDSTIQGIDADLIRSAKLARRDDAYKKWKKTFPTVVESPDWYDKGQGELIIIYQQGWGPRKVPSPGEYRMPTLRPVFNQTQRARLNILNRNFDSREVYNVEAAAIKTLNEDQGILMAKRVAGLATKAVLADQVRQKDKVLGELAWIAMNLADRADLRQWSLLPQSIQIIRVNLPQGTYAYSLEGLSAHGASTGEGLFNQEIQIKSKQKKFVVWRSLK